MAPATSVGLHLYGHGGELGILLNSDDDESFQAEAIKCFRPRRWGELAIPELEGQVWDLVHLLGNVAVYKAGRGRTVKTPWRKMRPIG